MQGPKRRAYFKNSSFEHALYRLRNQHLINIKFQHGLYRLIQDKHHPWLHAGAMLNVRRALDDETMEVYNTTVPPEVVPMPRGSMSVTMLDLLRKAWPKGMTIDTIVKALGWKKEQCFGAIHKLQGRRGGAKITKASGHGKPYILITE